ncbi:Transposon Ty3-G Gag-Pol polyprotein [Araneus ventricosus]|uniref:Transposon Ty3-G Gag-Pol polyprotein n=1 Tax=Araneus ventricosus TaxID=182803 RepID=A0A4Y2B631_ARAVE|nr:Transposon Ty3-G Gag-Pol polyprotein [Araneus ventricosus]
MDRYPLPILDGVIDSLENSKVFTTLYLKNGFFHQPIDPERTKYTAFVVPNAQYEFLKAPFGLFVPPNFFKIFIIHTFIDIWADKTLLFYMDGIIISSQDESENLKKLKRVLRIASENGIKLNFENSSFLHRKIEFLGYTIQNGTIRPSPSETAAVQNFPIPTTIKKRTCCTENPQQYKTQSNSENPFELLTSVSMKRKEETQILRILEEKYQRSFQEQREQMKEQAKENIRKIQEKNYHTFNRETKTTT